MFPLATEPISNGSVYPPDQVQTLNINTDQNAQATRIASGADLEKFASLPMAERQLTNPLRAVLLEIALTGVIRFNWSLLRPLVEFLTEQTLHEYQAAAVSADTEGPSPPVFPGEDLSTTVERFKTCLGRFQQAPWTIQRLCEVLLAPRNQYSKLHKVALAIEKCLMVTSEVGMSAELPPPPLVSDLARPVNVNPPPVNPVKVTGQDMEADNSVAFTNTLLGVHGPTAASDWPNTTAAASSSAADGASTSGTAGVIAVGPALTLPSAGNAVATASNGSMTAHHVQVQAQHHHHHHHHHHGGTHGLGSPGAGITPQEHMEEDHWPDPGLRPGLGAPLHSLASHHHTAHPPLHPIPTLLGGVTPLPAGTALLHIAMEGRQGSGNQPGVAGDSPQSPLTAVAAATAVEARMDADEGAGAVGAPLQDDIALSGDQGHAHMEDMFAANDAQGAGCKEVDAHPAVVVEHGDMDVDDSVGKISSQAVVHPDVENQG